MVRAVATAPGSTHRHGSCCRMRASVPRSWHATSSPKWTLDDRPRGRPGRERSTTTGSRPAGVSAGAEGRGQFCTLNLDGFVTIGSAICLRRSRRPWRRAVGVRALGVAPGRGRLASWAIRVARRLLHVQRAHVRQRLSWVQLQQGRRGEFHPQPYRHLARCCGRRATTRRPAKWRSPSSGQRHPNWVSRLLRPIWGFCFGFGLSPVRATADPGAAAGARHRRGLVGLEAGSRFSSSRIPMR